MRLPSAFRTLTATVLLFLPSTAFAADTATSIVPVNVQVSSRMSLRVSAELLQFTIDPASGMATFGVDFTAAARVAAGSDVVLSIEPVHGIDGPGGAADVDASLDFSGIGQGTISGTLAGAAVAAAGRWRGSGLRQGRVVFVLHAAAPGLYTMPVRFVLSTP